MVVRALAPTDDADVELYRRLRLASLAADPGAFASDLERESAFDAATWRRRLTEGPAGPAAVFVDEVDGEAVDLVGIVHTELDPAPEIVGMWVRSEARGTGAARRLLDAALAWADEREVGEVVLWVVHDNAPAIGLYERSGFVATGRTDTEHPCAAEVEMRRRSTTGRR